MPEASSPPDPLLTEAAKMTRECSWLEAAGLYEKVLLKGQDNPGPPRIQSEMARCLFQAAFQADTRAEFKNLMSQAKQSYDKAAELYDRAGSKPKSLLARGKGLCAQFWERDEYEERKSLLLEALHVTETASSSLDPNLDALEFAESKKDILYYRSEALAMVPERDSLLEGIATTLRIADEAILCYRNLDPTGLLECMKMALQLTIVSTVFGVTPHNEGIRKAVEKEAEMRVLARKIGTPFAFFLEAEASGTITHELLG